MAGDGLASELPGNVSESPSSLQDVVLDSSRTLMSAHPDEFDTKLSWTLGSVGEAFGADRCGAYQVESGSDGDRLVLTHEWYADGTDEHGDAARTLEAEALPWLFEQLQGFQTASADPADDLPEEAAGLGGLLAEEGVTAAHYMPMVSNWTLIGAVSFEATGGGNYEREDVDLTETFGDMVGHALAQVNRERELRQKNERLEQFASVVSHDLRNPLNVTKASIDLARGDDPEEHLDRAAEAAERMERIVEQVLTLARLGQDIGETEPAMPTEVAEEAWESIRAGEATLSVEPGDPIEADRHRLQEAFENLFRNAIEHGGAGVAIEVGPLSSEPGFYVADDGEGIPQDERDEVLEQGYTTSDDGTGLGLSIVSRIVEAHGWTVEVGESAAGGARFEVRTDLDGD